MDQRGQRGAFFFSPGWTAEDRARHKHSLPGYQCSTVGVTPFKTRKSGRQKGRHTECQAGFWIEGGDSSEKKKIDRTLKLPLSTQLPLEQQKVDMRKNPLPAGDLV